MGANRSKLSSVSSQISSTSTESSNEISFDDFQILRAIGKGSFGKVCIVQKKDSGAMYAMKYCSKALCLEKDAVRNVLREIELLTLLEHPFIVNLWFTFQDEEDIFMVVDLLLGGDLRYHLQHMGHISEQRVAFYLFEIALALDYLQSQRILHRDVKPDNILLDEVGHVHLTDFNVAIKLQDTELATSLSGTKPYMAPEVFESALDMSQGYSFSADWWSLGVTFYELLSGHRPAPHDIHSTTPLNDILIMQRCDSLSFPSHVSHAFAHLLQRLMCYSPSDRISSVHQLQTRCSYSKRYDVSAMLRKQVSPPYVPPKDQLNCDPTFELEEMIIETNPLHKKKKRLSKQQSVSARKVLEHQASSSFSDHGLATDETKSLTTASPFDAISHQFIVYNKERVLDKRRQLEKEKIWEEELEKVIK
ncbi:Serine/threonine-protein kinase 32B [Halotydeus destructor]|nr:Serine/threonine-protein kinase 32B [Halotydeus destructor]